MDPCSLPSASPPSENLPSPLAGNSLPPIHAALSPSPPPLPPPSSTSLVVASAAVATVASGSTHVNPSVSDQSILMALSHKLHYIHEAAGSSSAGGPASISVPSTAPILPSISSSTNSDHEIAHTMRQRIAKEASKKLAQTQIQAQAQALVPMSHQAAALPSASDPASALPSGRVEAQGSAGPRQPIVRPPSVHNRGAKLTLAEEPRPMSTFKSSARMRLWNPRAATYRSDPDPEDDTIERAFSLHVNLWHRLEATEASSKESDSDYIPLSVLSSSSSLEQTPSLWLRTMSSSRLGPKAQNVSHAHLSTLNHWFMDMIEATNLEISRMRASVEDLAAELKSKTLDLQYLDEYSDEKIILTLCDRFMMEISRREKAMETIRALREKLTSIIQHNESLFKKLKPYCMPHFGRKARRPPRLAAADLEPLLGPPSAGLAANGFVAHGAGSGQSGGGGGSSSNSKKKRHAKEKASSEKKLSSDEKLD